MTTGTQDCIILTWQPSLLVSDVLKAVFVSRFMNIYHIREARRMRCFEFRVDEKVTILLFVNL